MKTWKTDSEEISRIKFHSNFDKKTKELKIKAIENPREEQEEHYYNPVYKRLTDLGVKPHLLSKQYMIDMIKTVEKFKSDINQDAIFNGVKWVTD